MSTSPADNPKLSALVVIHNEESQLEECLSSLSFADELVVVLDRCTDGSKAIAECAGVTLLEGAWELEGKRRNEGIHACTGDWILEVDADERVTPRLATEIRARIIDAPFGHFLIPFDNYVGSRLIRHGWGASWGVSATVRLFAKGAKHWGGERVHPSLELRGQTMHLQSHMIHYVDRNISDMLMRLDRYTSARACDLRDSGNIGGLTRALGRLVSRFWKCYVRRRGYREGLYGFLIALMAGLYPVLSHIKAKLETE